MAVADWNWKLEADYQDYPWDCAACSFAWCARTVGYGLSEQDVIAGLGPSRISPTSGLQDASGAGLVQYASEIGIAAENNPDASWDDVVAAAGFQPMLIGGRAWNHWVAVRMGSSAAGLAGDLPLLLMNPAPGYEDVGQALWHGLFEALGPFSAVWFTDW